MNNSDKAEGVHSPDSHSESRAVEQKYFPRRRLLAAVILGVAIVDQISKIIAVEKLENQLPVDVIGQWFQLVLVRNPGAAFSIGVESTWVFTTIQLLYIAVVLGFSTWLRSPISALAAGLVAGGALGNLIDRLFRDPSFYIGHVVDFLAVRGFAVFNLADAAITVGVIILAVWLIFSKEPDIFAALISKEKQQRRAQAVQHD